MKRTLNIKFAVYLFSPAILCAAGVHFLHEFQVNRNATAFRDRGNRAREAGKPDQAIEYLGRYLALRPRDTESLAEYALLVEEQAKSHNDRMRVFLLLDQVLRSDPSRADVRRKLVQVAMRLNRFLEAKDNLKDLRRTSPEDGELEELLGQCELARGEYREARGSFERACRLAPERIDSYVLLATLLRQHPDEVLGKKEKAAGLVKLADAGVDAMVAANKGDFRAYVARAGYRRRFAPATDSTAALQAAEQDLDMARRLAPDDPVVLLTGGEVARARRDFDKARAYLLRSCEKHPRDVRAFRLLAAVEIEDGKADQAVTCLEQGLERVPGHSDLLWDLADALLQAGKITQAGEVAERLRQVHFPAAMLDYLQGRIHMARQEWLRAARLLEGAYPLLTADESLAEQAGLALGGCYERLGDSDRALAAYNRVAALAPRSPAPRVGLARVYANLGQIPEALDQYDRLMRLPNAPASARLEIARLRILQNLQRDQPSWAEVDAALAQAEKALPPPRLSAAIVDLWLTGIQAQATAPWILGVRSSSVCAACREISTEVILLRAEALAARKDYDRARAELEQAVDGNKLRPVQVWVALAALEERRGHADAVLPLLDQAEREQGDCVELRLARAQHWAERKGSAALESLNRLAEDTTRFTDEERQRLLRGLADAYSRVGAPEQAGRLWVGLAERHPDDLGILVARFNLAFQAGDETAAGHILDDMRRIEGPEGTLWRYAMVCRLLALAGKGQEASLEEARSLLSFVAVRRPRWSRVPLCAAQIEDLRKNPDGALVNYLAAIRLGDRSPLAIRRAAEILSARGRHIEANEIIRKLPEHVPLSGGLQRVVAEVMLRAGDDRNRALELAENAVAADSKDYREHIWLGRMLAASGQKNKTEKAEGAFRQAVSLADTTPEPWLALVRYLTVNGKIKEAEAEVVKAQRKLTGKEAVAGLAACHEVLGFFLRRSDRAAAEPHLRKAEELYHTALKANPEDVNVLQAAAGFSLRNNNVAATETYLRKIIRLNKDPRTRAIASRQLALVLSAKGGYLESREVLELAGITLDEGLRPSEVKGGTAEEMRTRALFLAVQQSRRERRQAIPLLEELIGRHEATPEDQFTLAQLYDGEGNWPKTRQRLATVAALSPRENPRSIAHRIAYADLLVTHGENEEAQLWLEKVEKQEPDSLRIRALKARLLKVQGKGREAVALLLALAQEKEPGILNTIAALLEGIGEKEAAESVYRDFVKGTRDKKPENALVLAQYLGRQGRVREALDVCEEARKKCRPVAVAQACLLILGSASPDTSQCERAERLLTEAEQKADSSGCQAALAHVKTLRGRLDEAEAIYRKAIETNARDSMALNNLAYLLALRGGRGDEAMKLVERAFQIAGPEPNILDTRAVVALSLDRPEAAVKDLTEAIREAPTGTAYFHLALAHQASKNLSEARKALRMAHARGLTVGNLHPLERVAYQELVRKLG
jgi:tetratricopeptide (TPR) repeat protein